MLMQKQQKGFTEIELMIVVAIIAILAAVAILAYTAYTDYMKRAKVANAFNFISGQPPHITNPLDDKYLPSGCSGAPSL